MTDFIGRWAWSRRAREWLRLREAEALAAARPATPAGRQSLRAALALARQKAWAARLLAGSQSAPRRSGCSGPAARSSADAAESALGAAEQDLPGTAAVRGAIAALREDLGAPDGPLAGGRLGKEHRQRLARLRRRFRRLERSVVPLALGPGGLHRLRLLRWTGVAVVLLLLAAALGWAGYAGCSARHASASLDLVRGPANAADGDEATEWVLPDGVPGWLRVCFRDPREVHAVRLLNSFNPPWKDRGTREFWLSGIRGGRVVAEAQGTFLTFPGRAWVTVRWGRPKSTACSSTCSPIMAWAPAWRRCSSSSAPPPSPRGAGFRIRRCLD